MAPELAAVKETSKAGPAAPTPVADAEAQDFEERELRLEHLRQNIAERKKYAGRIFVLVAFWLTAILALVSAQGYFGPDKRFVLSDSVLIAVATSTTASVTAILFAVVRYLFPVP